MVEVEETKKYHIEGLYVDPTTGKRTSFLLGKQKEPLYQPWEFQLRQHKQNKVLALPWPEKNPTYIKFKTETADKVAMAIRPVCFGIFFILATLLLIFNNLSSFWWWLGAGIVTPFLLTFSYYTLTQCIYETKIKIRNANIPDNIAA